MSTFSDAPLIFPATSTTPSLPSSHRRRKSSLSYDSTRSLERERPNDSIDLEKNESNVPLKRPRSLISRLDLNTTQIQFILVRVMICLSLCLCLYFVTVSLNRPASSTNDFAFGDNGNIYFAEQDRLVVNIGVEEAIGWEGKRLPVASERKPVNRIIQPRPQNKVGGVVLAEVREDKVVGSVQNQNKKISGGKYRAVIDITS